MPHKPCGVLAEIFFKNFDLKGAKYRKERFLAGKIFFIFFEKFGFKYAFSARMPHEIFFKFFFY